MSDFANLNMNLDDIDENQGGFEPIPEGEYPVLVEEMTVGPNRAETGIVIKVKFGIVEGTYTNRKVFQNFNWENPNEQAQLIGRGEFKRFCLAVGASTSPKSEAEFLDRPLRLRLGIRKDKNTGADVQSILKYIPYSKEVEARQEEERRVAVASGKKQLFKK